MSTLGDERWRAIGSWKQVRRRERSIGDLVRPHADRLQRVNGEPLESIRACLAEAVAPDFDRHCRVATFDGRRLTIAVDDPGRMDMLRRTYLFVVLERLSELAPRVVVSDVTWTVYRER